MRDPWEHEALAQRFQEFAATAFPRAPLYASLSAGIARDRTLSGLLFHAPPDQRLPVLLLACVHSLLLEAPDHPLAAWYPNLTAEPRSPEEPELTTTFKHFANDRAPALLALLATRSTQTNEVGRCAMFLPAFGRVAEEMGSLAHVDVGCSGGLTLQLDRYRYRYESDERLPAGSERQPVIIGNDSPVELCTSFRGDLGLPRELPSIAARVGLDVAPIDVTDPDQAHWLEACVWPDQPDRFHRLRSAIALAVDDPPRLVQGDATADVASVVASVAADGHPVITNSWVLNYLSGPERTAYVAELDRIGTERDLTWIFAESPAFTPELPWDVDSTEEQLTVTSLARWRRGTLTVEHLTTSHPHGYWIHAR